MRDMGGKEACRFLFFPLASQIHFQVFVLSKWVNDGIDGKKTILLTHLEKFYVNKKKTRPEK